MVIKPTYDDANLILRLYEERREDKMRAAREWFAQNFKFHTIEDFNRGCPPGSSMNAYARMIMSYWEMAASFVTAVWLALHQLTKARLLTEAIAFPPDMSAAKSRRGD